MKKARTHLSRFKSANSPEGLLAGNDVWKKVRELAEVVDDQIRDFGVDLTSGGEPTFVSAADRVSRCWWFEPLGEEKFSLAWKLAYSLLGSWGPEGLVIETRGKTYPGEPEARWALACITSINAMPLWRSRHLLASPHQPGSADIEDARRFILELASRFGVSERHVIELFEPFSEDGEPQDHEEGMEMNDYAPGAGAATWRYSVTVRGELAGYMLHLEKSSMTGNAKGSLSEGVIILKSGELAAVFRVPESGPGVGKDDNIKVICAEILNGHIRISLPASESKSEYLEILSVIEGTAEAENIPLIIAGYLPPEKLLFERFDITPDPGVIEVNMAPAKTWQEWEKRISELHYSARETGLDARRFMLNGLATGTGGGNHMLLGSAKDRKSPFRLKPQVLASMIAYWNNHPSLSYAFAGMSMGQFSQHPRADESRIGNINELEIALAGLRSGSVEPDDALRHILVDAVGNPHRAEFCIDKLPLSGGGRSLGGLLELRAFEMQPTARMNLLTHLLVRALFAWFWEKPYRNPLEKWSTALQDRFLLPSALWSDILEVIDDLSKAGFGFEPEWFRPLWDWRFPVAGLAQSDVVRLEIRQALEPWIALSDLGSSRFVDSSIERLQISLASDDPKQYVVLCNDNILDLRPLDSNDTEASSVYTGLRYRAWAPVGGIHPGIQPHAPLVLDVRDRKDYRLIIRCVYYSQSPDGEDYEDYPQDEMEAARRREERFIHVSDNSNPPGVAKKRLKGKARYLPYSTDHPFTSDLCRIVIAGNKSR